MEANKTYHIYNRGVNKQDIFFDNENYIYFLKQFDKYLSGKADALAYCLMPNHFHFLIRIKEISDPPNDGTPGAVKRSLKNFLMSYAKAVNKRYGRTGALFQQKYKRKEVDNEFYFSWLVQYLHMNPVKGGLCNHPATWKFSSYNAIVSGKPTKICAPEILEWFGGIDEFIRIHNERVIDEDELKRFLFDD